MQNKLKLICNYPSFDSTRENEIFIVFPEKFSLQNNISFAFSNSPAKVTQFLWIFRMRALFYGIFYVTSRQAPSWQRSLRAFSSSWLEAEIHFRGKLLLQLYKATFLQMLLKSQLEGNWKKLLVNGKLSLHSHFYSSLWLVFSFARSNSFIYFAAKFKAFLT